MTTEATVSNHPAMACVVCDAYLRRRGDILPESVVASARRRLIRAQDLFLEFMTGVHTRHTAGHSLAPAPCDCIRCLRKAVA